MALITSNTNVIDNFFIPIWQKDVFLVYQISNKAKIDKVQ